MITVTTFDSCYDVITMFSIAKNSEKCANLFFALVNVAAPISDVGQFDDEEKIGIWINFA